MKEQAAVSAAVLAGGRGKRLGGVDKALINWQGRPLIASVVEVLREVADEVIIVGREESEVADLRLPARAVPDLVPEAGALGGLLTALHSARWGHTLVVACDMPFLRVDLLSYLVSLAPDYDVVVPRFDGYLEPLHAVYARSCLGLVERQLEEGDLKIVDFFPRVSVRYVDAHEIRRFDPKMRSFFNINTPEQLETVRRSIEQPGGITDR